MTPSVYIFSIVAQAFGNCYIIIKTGGFDSPSVALNPIDPGFSRIPLPFAPINGRRQNHPQGNKRDTSHVVDL
jgi:hypothetical protein